jgi:minor extracellular serine protease Vpr
MARPGTTATPNDACAALPTGSLNGMAALIRRGTCSFYTKATNAQNAGAAAVVIYNNVAGALNPTVEAPTPANPPITIPVVAITAAQGAALDALFTGGSAPPRLPGRTITSAGPTAPGA